MSGASEFYKSNTLFCISGLDTLLLKICCTQSKSYFACFKDLFYLRHTYNVDILIKCLFAVYKDCTNQQLDRFGLFHLEGISDHFALFHLENMPFCLLKNLKKISFKDVEGEFHELEAIKYLLKFSRVLESFSIKTKGGRSSKVEKIKDLILRFFPKASQFCEIKFVEKL